MPTGPLRLEGRLSRTNIALNQAVWWIYAGMFAIFAIGTVGMTLIFSQFHDDQLLPFAASLLLVALIAFRTRPQPIGSIGNHLAIASVGAMTTLGMFAFRPGALVPVGAAMFAGPFTAVRLRSPWQICAHLALATVLLAMPVALGLVNRSVDFAILTMLPAMWVLAFCCVIIVQAAEDQGEELEQLVRRDPLTGVGNRRLLTDTLEDELELHERSGRPLSIVAIDLNGFKAINDSEGHDAGDALLQDVARALVAVSDESDTVVRQGGDEFCILLPDGSATEARAVEAAIRSALAELIHGGGPVTTGVGSATFPADGRDADALLAAADARLAVDKAGSERGAPIARATAMPQPSRVAAPTHAPQIRPSMPIAHEQSGLLARVSRRELAVNPYTWFATGLMYFMFAAVGLFLLLQYPGARPSAPVVCVAFLLLCLWIFSHPPPELGTTSNHLLLATVYVGAATFMAAFPRTAGVAFGAAVFIGPLTGVRLIDRREIAAHYAAATLVFTALVVTGLVNQTTSLSLLIVILAVWGLGVSVLAVLEAAERQSDELELLVRRDPLTGVGNRRLLHEQLTHEIGRHSRSHRPFTVLTLDLNGFKGLNDRLGHAAGDQLLCDVANALSGAVRSADTVVRQGGDEFCVIIPETDAQHAIPTANEIRTALARIDAQGQRLSAGIGVSSYPADAITGDALLHVADEQLLVSKQTSFSATRDSGRDSGPVSALRIHDAG